MRESELGRAKTCFRMMALGTLFSLLEGMLPESNSPLGGVLTLASFVLVVIAIWRLREVEEGYRRAFLVEVIGLIVLVIGTALTAWATASGLGAVALVTGAVVVTLPMISGGIFQYLFCTATGRVMEEIGAAREAVWSGWMWKLYGIRLIAGAVVSVLVLFGKAPEFLVILTSWIGFLINVLQIAYYFICSRALPEG